MFVAIVIAALVVDGLFSARRPDPGHPARRAPTSSARSSSTTSSVLNLLGLVIFAALFYLTARRGVTDPVCGMKVDRTKALRAAHAGRTYFFCSENCRSQFQADPEAYTRKGAPAAAAHAH